MEELILNLHNHTTYSDGTGSHQDILHAAGRAGLDAVIVTDHNVLVHGMEQIAQINGKKVALLVGEEVHDQARDPQKSHLLVFGAGRELATWAPDPQMLIDRVNQAGGICFLAHPFERALPAFDETAITWEDWQVTGYTGLELWNGLSELKSVAHGLLDAAFYALFPHHIARGPDPETLRKWDELTTAGQRVVAVGGADAHALRMHLGPIHRTIFPYEFHYSAINNHLMAPAPLSGDLLVDRRMLLDTLRQGRLFIGYDLPAPTRGFRFSAQGFDGPAQMGDEVRFSNGITFQIRVPGKAETRLIRNGEVVKTWKEREICTFIANQPGVYRVECHIDYLGRKRGWIYSNPIYVKEI